MAITGWRFRPLSALSLDAGIPRSRRTAWGVRCCAMVSVGLPLLAFRQVRDRELSPASWRGFFVDARCATNSAARRWGGGFAECLEPVPFGLWFRCRSASPGGLPIAPFPRGVFLKIKKPTLRLGVESAGLLPHTASPLRWIDQT